ncbi:MAG: hypothetical protein WCZ86_15130, partial [Desulfurivibrionaceae bacterium]
MSTELTRFPPIAPADMLRNLQNLSPFHLWLVSQLISVAVSEIIVVGMEIILKGDVTYDYLLTGFVTSFFVSALVVRSGAANLNSVISGNSGYIDGPKVVCRQGVSDGKEEGIWAA